MPARLQPFGPCSIHPCCIGTSTWSRENVILISAPGIAAQLVVIEGDTEAGLVGHVDPEVREAQGLLDKIVDEDLRAEMLATPGELTQSAEDLQMRRSADRALQQAAPVEADPGRLGHRRHISGGKEPAMLDEL